MQDLIAVKRYTEAYLGYCRETAGIEEGITQLRKFAGIMAAVPGLRAFLESGVIGQEEKRSFIGGVLRREFSPGFCDLAELLLDKRRIALLGEIAGYAVRTYPGGEPAVVVETAGIMDTGSLRRLKGILERRLRRKVRMYLRFDPGLIAGFRVIAGTTVIDASLQRCVGDLKGILKKTRMGDDGASR